MLQLVRILLFCCCCCCFLCFLTAGIDFGSGAKGCMHMIPEKLLFLLEFLWFDSGFVGEQKLLASDGEEKLTKLLCMDSGSHVTWFVKLVLFLTFILTVFSCACSNCTNMVRFIGRWF